MGGKKPKRKLSKEEKHRIADILASEPDHIFSEGTGLFLINGRAQTCLFCEDPLSLADVDADMEHCRKSDWPEPEDEFVCQAKKCKAFRDHLNEDEEEKTLEEKGFLNRGRREILGQTDDEGDSASELSDESKFVATEDVPTLRADFDNDTPKIIVVRAALNLPIERADRDILADVLSKPFYAPGVCEEHGVADCWPCKKQRREESVEREEAGQKKLNDLASVNLIQSSPKIVSLQPDETILNRWLAEKTQVCEERAVWEQRNNWILEKGKGRTAQREIDASKLAQGLRKVVGMSVREVAALTKDERFLKTFGMSGLDKENTEMYRAYASNNFKLEDMIQKYGRWAGEPETLLNLENQIMQHFFRVGMLILPEGFGERPDERDDRNEEKQNQEVLHSKGGSINGSVHRGKLRAGGQQRLLNSFRTPLARMGNGGKGSFDDRGGPDYDPPEDD